MRRLFYACSILTFLFLTNSCQSLMEIPSTTNPRLEVSDQEHRIAFINMYDYTSIADQSKKKKENETLKKGARELIYMLEKSIAEDSLFELVFVDPLLSGRALDDFPDLPDPEFVRSTCKLHEVDLLLLLDFFMADINTRRQESTTGDISINTNNYDLTVEAGFTLYQSNGALIDRVRETKIMRFKKKWAPMGLIAIEPSLAKASDEITELAAQIGHYFVENFYQSHEIHNSMVYKGGDLSGAITAMEQWQWDEAIEILLPLAQSPDQELAQKAAHNLSLCYFAVGNLNESDYWERKAEAD